jgi:glutaredoxin 3
MSDKVKIYGTETCPFCVQARESYGDGAVFIDVSEDPAGLQEMLALSGGRRQVPVIVDGERVKVGFLGETSLRGGVPIFGGT